MKDVVDKLVDEIERWQPGQHFIASYTSDGAGHSDFMSFTVTPEGKASLSRAVKGLDDRISKLESDAEQIKRMAQSAYDAAYPQLYGK